MKSFAKKTLAATLAALGVSAVAQAAPLVSIGDSVDIFFNGSTNAQWRSNLFYTDGIDNTPAAIVLGVPAISRPKESAFVFYVSPGLEVNVGRNSNANLRFYFREDFLFYTKYSDELNTALANLYLDGVYDFGKLSTSAGFSFVQTQQNSPGTNGFNFVANLVETNQFSAYADADYDISPKAWASGRFNWRYTDYTNNDEFFNRYSNMNLYEAPLTLYWRLTPKLSIGPSFRARYTQVDESGGYAGPAGLGFVGPTPTIDNPDYMDYFFNIAVNGEVMPKLSVMMNVGYQLRDPINDRVVTPFLGLPVSRSQDVRHQFAFDARAEYEITPKLFSYVDFAHDFGVGAEGQTTVNLGGDIGLRYEYNQYLVSTAEFGMENTDYQNTNGREDLTTTFNVNMTYSPDVYWSFSLGYYYINNNSTGNTYFLGGLPTDNTGGSFQAHTINLQATFRY